jgi:2-dehydropantoate 2-reductase
MSCAEAHSLVIARRNHAPSCYLKRRVKFCIYGAGAIGGYLAVELATAGHDVCVIARGDHLKAIQEARTDTANRRTRKNCASRRGREPTAVWFSGCRICTLKAHQANTSAPDFAPLLGPSSVLTAMNGIPWWYFYKNGGRFEGHQLPSVDPAGRQWQFIGPQRAIGCVVEPACEVAEPGIILHHQFNRLIIGEPDGSHSTRVTALSKALNESGIDAPVRDNIRWNIWLKLWGNVCFNPISALTGATLNRITSEPGLLSLCRTMMFEAKGVNEALGIQIPLEMMDRRLAAAGSVAGHKMSMLQDLERGRSLEIDALVTAVQEIGRLTGVPTPIIDTVLALVQERGRRAHLYV